MRKLPPLNALRTFEAAARHESFTLAAQELNVTTTAVSHQIRHLEELLGVKLFERSTRAVKLTPMGQRLFPPIREGFDRLAEGFAEIQERRGAEVISLTTTRAFAERWLMPRLAAFHADEPDIQINIDASEETPDLRTAAVDLAIRYGRDGSDDLDSQVLMHDHYIAVCHASLCPDDPTPTLNTVGSRPLIGYRWKNPTLGGPDWAAWFQAAGIAAAETFRISWYSEETLAIQAMEHGYGAVLCSDVLVADGLRRGDYRRIQGPALPGLAFRLLHAPGAGRRPVVRRFARWLAAQAASLSDG